MSAVLDSATDTTPKRKRSFHSVLVALTLAPSATVASAQKIPFRWNQPAVAATSAADMQQLAKHALPLSSGTSKRGMTFDEAVSFFGELLAKNGLTPSRKSITGDGSMLFQFLGENKACVDVYPSGVVAVILRKGEMDEFRELEMQDARLILSLLKDAGVSS